jgi:DNA topoisomerase I
MPIWPLGQRRYARRSSRQGINRSSRLLARRLMLHAAVAQLEKADYKVAAIDEKPTRSFPSAPFITSTLQQAASVRLGYSVKKTMMLAQRLYEAGYITYMRTDSTNLSGEAVATCRTLIEKQFGARYLPEKPPTYASKEGAQEAHEAIRPTDARTTVDELGRLDADEGKLYDLIWRQFLACQMTPAEYDTAAITIGAQGSKERFELRVSGRVMRFDGWLKVMPPAKKEETVLPKVTVGQQLKLVKLDPTQHFTKPPPRFSEASLVKELEKRGIGRPSTYAAIISTIQDRGYVKLNNRRFYAEKLGDIVTDRLVENFTELLDYGFTAGLEEDLDEIATAKEEWKVVLDRFYKDFKGKITTAKGKMRSNQPVATPITCPKCGRPMAIRTGRTGVFLSCTGYSLPKEEKCTGTLNLVPGDEAVAVSDDTDEEGGNVVGEAEVLALRAKRRCPICKTAMDSYLVDEKRKLHICGNNPDCAGVAVEEGTFKIKGYDGPTIPCDKCGAPMQLRSGRFGKYFGCTAYPDCKNTRKLLRNGQPAPPKAPPIHMPELKCETTDAYFVLRDGAVGIFLAANNYPKSRETRSPQVADLVRHRSELDPKFNFLAEAPVSDPKGNPSLIRFSRKTREHYLISESDGEPTGWMAFYVDGKWVARKATEAEKKETTRKFKRKAPAKT